VWTDKNRAKYNRDHLRYPSDLTDDEWAHVEPLIPPAKRGGGKRRTDMRSVMNDNAPVTVFLAVLPSPCESQVHGPRFYAQTKSPKEGRSSLHAFPPHRPLKRFSFRRRNSKIGAPVGKVGLGSGDIAAPVL
jgi:hypothetical protein